MAQVTHYDKRVGITYVYESESYYDPSKKQSRSKRTLIGKIDPETGEIVPTGKRGRPSKNAATDESGTDYEKLYKATRKKLEKADAKIQALESELKDAKLAVSKYRGWIDEISDICSRKM